MEAKTIGELVDQLFKTHRRPDGKEYTYQEVADGVNSELDPTYIGKLRSGKVPNPGRNTLKLLCLFFQVPSAYFFPELEGMAPANEDPSIAGEHQIRLALRSAGLSPDVQNYLQGLIKALRDKQG